MSLGDLIQVSDLASPLGTPHCTPKTTPFNSPPKNKSIARDVDYSSVGKNLLSLLSDENSLTFNENSLIYNAIVDQEFGEHFGLYDKVKQASSMVLSFFKCCDEAINTALDRSKLLMKENNYRTAVMIEHRVNLFEASLQQYRKKTQLTPQEIKSFQDKLKSFEHSCENIAFELEDLETQYARLSGYGVFNIKNTKAFAELECARQRKVFRDCRDAIGKALKKSNHFIEERNYRNAVLIEHEVNLFEVFLGPFRNKPILNNEQLEIIKQELTAFNTRLEGIDFVIEDLETQHKTLCDLESGDIRDTKAFTALVYAKTLEFYYEEFSELCNSFKLTEMEGFSLEDPQKQSKKRKAVDQIAESKEKRPKIVEVNQGMIHVPQTTVEDFSQVKQNSKEIDIRINWVPQKMNTFNAAMKMFKTSLKSVLDAFHDTSADIALFSQDMIAYPEAVFIPLVSPEFLTKVINLSNEPLVGQDETSISLDAAKITWHEFQGVREEMQDAYFHKKTEDYVLLGVFDGHGDHGKFLSKEACRLFEENFDTYFKEKKNIHQAFEALFYDIQVHLLNLLPLYPNLSGGSTAVVTFIHKSGIAVTATLGDSEATIYRIINGEWQAIPMSRVVDWGNKKAEKKLVEHHRIDWIKGGIDPQKEKEILKLLASTHKAKKRRSNIVFKKLENGRIKPSFSGVNMQSSFFDYKYSGTLKYPLVTSKPQISVFEVFPGDKVVLACDGVKDFTTEDEIITIIENLGPNENLAVKLVDTAFFDKKSSDNISVIAIEIPDEFDDS